MSMEAGRSAPQRATCARGAKRSCSPKAANGYRAPRRFTARASVLRSWMRLQNGVRHCEAGWRLPRCFARWGALLLVVLAVPAHADVDRRTLNDGNLVLEDVPEIPIEVVNELNRYQNIRAASFRAFSPDGKSIFISTRFGDVDSLHRVDMPGGARNQISFYREPVGGVTRRPGSSELYFTRDAGGNEFAQIFQFDPATGDANMLTDGESRNGAVVWDRRGTRIAYQSTRRNGRSNDVWVMDPADPAKAKVALESPDGSWWGPAEFSASGGKLLLTNYVSVTDSRVHLLDLDSGESALLAGGDDKASTNVPVAFDDKADGFWLITDQGGEFNQLAWQPATPGATPEVVSGDIPWGVSTAVISHDRSRIAFVTNEDGMSRVYLLDTKSRKYRRVENIPTGLAYGIVFSADDRRLGMTLNLSQTPSDAFVLELG
mgnify:FL=1